MDWKNIFPVHAYAENKVSKLIHCKLVPCPLLIVPCVFLCTKVLLMGL